MRLSSWITSRFRKQQRRRAKISPVLLDSFKDKNDSPATDASSGQTTDKDTGGSSGDNGKPRPKAPTTMCEFISDVRLLPCDAHIQDYDDYERNGTLDITEVVLALHRKGF